MSIIVKASGLKFKYPRDFANRQGPKFSGLPDPAPFNRDDLYDILPMMTAVMIGHQPKRSKSCHTNSRSKRHLRWLVFGSSTYYV